MFMSGGFVYDDGKGNEANRQRASKGFARAEGVCKADVSLQSCYGKASARNVVLELLVLCFSILSAAHFGASLILMFLIRLRWL